MSESKVCWTFCYHCDSLSSISFNICVVTRSQPVTRRHKARHHVIQVLFWRTLVVLNHLASLSTFVLMRQSRTISQQSIISHCYKILQVRSLFHSISHPCSLLMKELSHSVKISPFIRDSSSIYIFITSFGLPGPMPNRQRGTEVPAAYRSSPHPGSSAQT